MEPLKLYRCKVCGTRWLLWPDAVHGGGWNLLDAQQRPGACCDNVPMGEQIEHLRDLPLEVATASPPSGWQPLVELVEDFNGWWFLNREGSTNAAYERIDRFTKAAREAIGAASSPSREESGWQPK